MKAKKTIFLSIVSLLVVLSLLTFYAVEVKSEEMDYDQLFAKVRILEQKPIAKFNQTFEKFGYFLPLEYEVLNNDDTLSLKKEHSFVIYYPGEGQYVAPNALTMINPNLEISFENIDESEKGKTKFFYIWKETDGMSQVIYGENDRYISARMPTRNLSKDVPEIVTIYNSVVELKND
ncbi:MAG: hypothetical protein ACRCUP_05835 [Mycoplasmatales bacterium]